MIDLPGHDAIGLNIGPIATMPAAAPWTGAPLRLTGDPTQPPPELALVIGENGTVAGAAERWSGRNLVSLGEPAGDACGLVCNFMDVEDGAREEFDAWYNTEHLPALYAIDGIVHAARYRADNGSSPAFLATYLMHDIAASQSAQWMQAARTPWSARTRKFVRNYRRLSFSRRAG